MQSQNIYSILNIDDFAVTPKYMQISNSIIKGVESLHLINGFMLPSINDMSYELDISRDTVEKAYRRLKNLGIVGSVPGKGYFISDTNFKSSAKILLLFNKLSAHKKIIYDEFVATLGNSAVIHFYIYNNDFAQFKHILEKNNNGYTHYVIIPHFVEGGENASEVINALKDGRLILLDKLLTNLDMPFSAVYENFERDIYNALESALEELSKYQTLVINFPSYSYFPKEILEGFQKFCSTYAFNYSIVSSSDEINIESGQVYINLMEDDLAVLLSKIKNTKLKVGKEIGIISYNETPWKQFILNGITTISTDFKKMGQMAAAMILENKNEKLEVPFNLILRPSL